MADNMFASLQNLAKKERKNDEVEVVLEDVQPKTQPAVKEVKKEEKAERFLFEMSADEKMKLERLRITKNGIISKAEVLRKLINSIDTLDNL